MLPASQMHMSRQFELMSECPSFALLSVHVYYDSMPAAIVLFWN